MLLPNQGQLLNLANDAIITVDANNTITFGNHQAVKIFGYGASEIIGKSLEDLFPQPLAATYCKKIAHLASMLSSYQQRKNTFELYALRQDGTEFLAEASISGLELNDEKIIAITLRDISEQIPAEMAVFESEQHFQIFMNYSPAVQWMTDSNGCIVYANKTYLKTFKLTTDDVIGKNVFELFDSQFAMLYFHSDNEVLATNKRIKVIEIISQANGKIGNFIVYKFPFQDALGNCFVGGIAVEITERKQAGKAFLESEFRYFAAAEGSLDAFFLLQCLRDKTARIIDFVFIDTNSQAEEILALPQNKIIGQKLCELLPSYRTNGLFEKYVWVVENQKVLQEEYQLHSSEIKANCIHHQVVPLPNVIAITYRHITAAKEAEYKVQQANEQLTNWVQEIGLKYICQFC